MISGALPIVGIGASAGGVEALSALFKHMQPDSGAAFVVVTHLAPKRESLLPEILGRCTEMPVEAAQDGQTLKANHVYLIPPDFILTILRGHLALKAREGEHNPIDICFASLAKEVGESAIAVVLSGTGSDGAIGVKAVREAGGFTLAQATGAQNAGPLHLSHRDMPDAAISTGFVDCVLPINELADRIVQYVRAFGAAGTTEEGLEHGAENLDESKAAIYALLEARVGHDFSRYKDKTFLRRVQRRMQVRQIPNLANYVDLLGKEPDEAMALFRDLLIGVTNFFRDPESFDRLAELVIPRLFEGKGVGDVVRIWIPGCATGEEAYSIAMLVREGMEKLPFPPRVQIFATDVDESALFIARAGHYPAGLAEFIAPARLERFFVQKGSSYTVAKEIRELCLFSSHSIIRDPPFSQLDMISCRNLLIYFSAELQGQVIPLFHYALKPGGFLFLGASENVTRHSELFAPVDKKRRIFQRCELAGRRPVFPMSTRMGGMLTRGDVEKAPFLGKEAERRLEQRVLEAYAPAHVMVNRGWDIVHYSARTGKYFEAPPGAPSGNILAVARKALRAPLRAALQEVLETGHPVRRSNVTFEFEGGQQTVDITAEALTVGEAQVLWLVVFNDIGTIRTGDEAMVGTGEPSPGGEDAAQQLEQELAQTRGRLQTTIEEYETSVEELKSANEELLSVNEELQSSNEELEASKEELQSVNEELQTVNQELGTKVEDLDRANADLKNLFASTRIAAAFLDKALVVRNFTPAMTEVFKLIPGDCGRPLTDIVSHIRYDGLAEDVGVVLETAEPIEKRVDRRDGHAHYLMRILPYRTIANQVDGVIVTLVEVTAIVEAEEHQRLLVAELNHRVKNMLAIISSMAAQMARRCETVKEFADSFVERVRGLAKTHELLSAREWANVDLADLLAGELAAFVSDSDRAVLEGPAIPLGPRAVTSLGIVIHELATNALKYGALSVPDGRLRVAWGFEDQDGARALVMTWRESGGPLVQKPEQRGLGSELVERCLEFELDGKADIEYPPEGVVATLTIPAIGNHMQGEGARTQ